MGVRDIYGDERSDIAIGADNNVCALGIYFGESADIGARANTRITIYPHKRVIRIVLILHQGQERLFEFCFIHVFAPPNQTYKNVAKYVC